MLVEGGQRACIARYEETENFFQAYAEVIEDAEGDDRELDALSRTAVSQFEQYIKLNKKIPPEVLVSINQIDERQQARRHHRLASHPQDPRKAGASGVRQR